MLLSMKNRVVLKKLYSKIVQVCMYMLPDLLVFCFALCMFMIYFKEEAGC